MASYQLKFTAPGLGPLQKKLATATASAQSLASAMNGINSSTLAQFQSVASGGGARGGNGGTGRTRNNSQAFMSRLIGLIKTTRVGVGPGGVSNVQPLIGRVVGLLGALGPQAEAAGIALAAMVAGISAITRVADEFNLVVAKSNLGTASSFIGTGFAYGHSPGQFSQIAEGVNGQIINNPLAMLYGQSNGFGPNYNGVFGADIYNQNRTRGLYNFVRDTPSDDLAQRVAFGTSATEALAYRHISPQAKKMQDDMSAQAADPANIQKSMEIQVRFNKLMMDFYNTMLNVASAIDWDQIMRGLGVSADLFGQLGHVLYDVYKVLSPVIGLITDLAQILSFVTGFLVKVIDWIADKIAYLYNLIDGKNGDMVNRSAQNHIDSMDSNTDALNRNTRALTNKAQIFNGGSYGSKALPAGAYYGDPVGIGVPI